MFKIFQVTLLVELLIVGILGALAYNHGNPFESLSEKHGGDIMFGVFLISILSLEISLFVSFYRYFISKSKSYTASIIYGMILSILVLGIPTGIIFINLLLIGAFGGIGG